MLYKSHICILFHKGIPSVYNTYMCLFFADLSQSYLVFIVERFSDVIDVFGYCLCNQARRLCHNACRCKVRIAGFLVQVVCAISTQPVLHAKSTCIRALLVFHIEKLFWRWWLVTRKRLTFWCNIKEVCVSVVGARLGYQSSVLCSASGVCHKFNITGSLLTLHYFVAWECHSELDNKF